jgi:hypothetical protein
MRFIMSNQAHSTTVHRGRLAWRERQPEPMRVHQ